jgi:transposase-like protein
MDLPKARLAWVELYAKTGDAGLVCRRCGISRPTLRKWWRRHQADGEAGLIDRSRRPHRLAAQRVFAAQEALILSLRRERRLGVKQLRNELIRQHDLPLALDTIHRALVRHGEQVLKRPRRWRKGERRYSRPIPGDRVQMDVCKIRPGVYQYTAIDDCSRYKVLGVYSRATGANTLSFLERVIEEMPHPAHPNRSRTRVLRRDGSAAVDGLGDQVSADPVPVAASEWQSRTDAPRRSGRILGHD